MKYKLYGLLKNKAFFIIATLCAVLFSACEGDDETMPQSSYLRFVNAFKGSSGNAEFMINGTELQTGAVELGGWSGYTHLYSGNYQLSAAFSSGSAANLSAETTAELDPSKYYSCFLSGQAGAPEMVLVPDDLSAPDSSNKAKIRFINLNPEISAVNIGIKDSTLLFSSQQYMKISNFSLIDTSAHTIVAYSGSGASEEVASADFHASAGRIYTFYIYSGPSPDNNIFLVYHENSR